MKRVKTADLIGAALDWAVAKCAGREIDGFGRYGVVVWELDALTGDKEACCLFTPSTHWAQGGPIIEREMIDLRKVYSSGRPSTNPYDCWKAEIVFRDEKLVAGDFFAHGPTLLIAAMRCFVASELGDEVDVPEELLK